MIKKFFIFLSILLCTHAHTMQHTPQGRTAIKPIAHTQQYTKQDIRAIKLPLCTMLAGSGLIYTGYTIQQPILVGFGAALLIGSIDDVSDYNNYEQKPVKNYEKPTI